MHLHPKKILFTLISSLAASAWLSAADLNNPTGTAGLLLIDKRGNSVRFLDPLSFKEISSFSTGQKAAHEVTISADHRTAYVPIYGDGVIRHNPNPGSEILIVDLPSRQVTGRIDLSPYQAPHGIQIDSKGLLYVACDISEKLLIVNPATREIEAAIDVGGSGHWVAVLPDASKAYISLQGGGDFISVVDLKARKMIGRVSVPGGSAGIIAGADGKRVFAMVGGAASVPTVGVIDTNTERLVDTVSLRGHEQSGYKLKISPDGSTLITCGYVYVNGPGVESFINIVKMSALHGDQQVVKAGKGSMGFAFSPDGKTALVANDGDGTVTVVNLRSGAVASSFKAGTGIENLTYY